MGIVYIFIVCLLVVAVGDPLLARAMRKHAPSAFAAAGSPSAGSLAILTPYFVSRYHRFIVRRFIPIAFVARYEALPRCNAFHSLPMFCSLHWRSLWRFG